MRAPWQKTTSQPVRSTLRLDLDQPDLFKGPPIATGAPMMVAIDRLDEDQDNPRTELPAHELEELAADIVERGILQPIVVEMLDLDGRCLIRFGAKRFRAARLAGLKEHRVLGGSSGSCSSSQCNSSSPTGRSARSALPQKLTTGHFRSRTRKKHLTGSPLSA
jgi:ParB-like nuclease domain